MSEARKYRKFSASQKLELVLASLRGDRSVAEICREHVISETLLRRWREQLLEAGAARLAGAEQRFRRSCARGSPSSSARSGARPTSWRSRESSCGIGSETARRPIP
jgi:transposase